MKFVLKYLEKYKGQAICAPLFKMFEAITELIVPLVMASIIDVGIANRDSSYVIRMGIVLILIALGGITVSVTAQYFSAKAAIGAATDMRRDVFEKINSLSFAQADQIGASSLTMRITNDINVVQSGINMVLRLFLRSPFIVVGAFVMALLVDIRSALIFCGVIPILAVIVYVVMRKTLPLYTTIQQRLEKILLRVEENLDGARVIRAFRQEDEEIDAYNGQVEELYGLQMKAGGFAALMNPMTYVVVNLGIVMLLWVGGDRVDTGVLTQGEVVALINYMNQILVELIKLANLIVQVMRAFPSVYRVQEVMELKSDERVHLARSNVSMAAGSKGTAGSKGMSGSSESAGSKGMSGSSESAGGEGTSDSEATAGVLEFDDVTFAYPGAAEPSLEHFSFTAKPGMTIGVIGGTGAGKSTLVRLIMHSYDVTDGELRLDSHDIRSFTDQELSARVGNVPQKAELFAGTIRSNLAMANASASDEDMWEAIAAAQAKEVVEGKDGGLNAAVTKNGGNFSGGQRQRLTIARALVKKPEILILDDSASALDLATEAALRKAIAHLEWHPQTWIVSQRASAVREADQIIVLENGKVQGIGTHQELIASCDVYQEIYYTQYPKEEA